MLKKKKKKFEKLLSTKIIRKINFLDLKETYRSRINSLILYLEGVRTGAPFPWLFLILSLPFQIFFSPPLFWRKQFFHLLSPPPSQNIKFSSTWNRKNFLKINFHQILFCLSSSIIRWANICYVWSKKIFA